LKAYTANGALIWVKLTAFHYTNRLAQPALLLGIIQECTQRVNEEKITLSIVNHEVRTPLSVIKLCAQLIERADKGRYKIAHTDLAGKIERHVDGITKLLDQYLSDAVDSAKCPPLNLSVFDLYHLIGQVVNDLAMINYQHKFIVQNPGSAMVKADKYLITQVLLNYLTNAIKYSPKNTGIKVDVCVNEQDIVVCITDQGDGVPAGLEKRIFERFFQCETRCEKEDTASKGLGLYLVKQIVERHKGSVWMQNASEKGSAFFFSLPAYCQ
jgi:two-component system CheB/CheR fusion protein